MMAGMDATADQRWNMDGEPWDEGVGLIQEDIDRIAGELEKGFARYPCLAEAGIKRWVNGAFTFTPDGNPLVGPVPGVPNYWAACGVMAGFLQGGGVGKSLAEWMIHGEPEADIYGMDVARYGEFASQREYRRQRGGRVDWGRSSRSEARVRVWAGGRRKQAPAHAAMTGNGARWGCAWGLEVTI